MSFIHCHDENQSTFRAGRLQSGLRLHCAQKKPFWEGSSGLPACCKAPDAPANPPCSRARSTARIQPGQGGNPFPGTQGAHCSPTAANPAGSSRQALLWAQLSRAPSVFHTDMYSLLQAATQPPHKYILIHTHTSIYTHTDIKCTPYACTFLATSSSEASLQHRNQQKQRHAASGI